VPQFPQDIEFCCAAVAYYRYQWTFAVSYELVEDYQAAVWEEVHDIAFLKYAGKALSFNVNIPSPHVSSSYSSRRYESGPSSLRIEVRDVSTFLYSLR
jgi:hypothetical protein